MGFSSLLLAFALLIKAITAQTIGNPLNPGLNFNGLPFGANFANGLAGAGLPGPGLPGTGLPGPGFGSCGGFAVTSTSHIAPTGVSVLAENLGIEGPLVVGGQLPFLGTIGLEGALPAIGSGSVSYGCGNGNIGITSEGLTGAGAPGPYGLPGQAYSPAPSYNPLANSGFGSGFPYGAGISGPGFAGPGIPGAAFGSSLGPGFGVGYGNNLQGAPGFGVGLPSPGLGYNGISGIGPGAALK